MQHFRFLSTPNGTSWEAYIAGFPNWFLAHVSGRTKPCLTQVTLSDLPCALCEKGYATTEVGYVPVYRQDDGRAGLVLVYSEMRDKLAKMKLHQRVKVARGKSRRDAVVISELLNPHPVFESDDPRRHFPIDLTDNLLRIWAMPALTEWYKKNFERVNDNALSEMKQRGTARAGTPERIAIVNQAFADSVKRRRERGERAPTEEPLEVKKILPILRNGKH